MSEHATAYRTHTCGELRGSDQKARVKLCGRVDRLLPGGKGFLIRDAAGATVVALAQKVQDAVKEAVAGLHAGDVVEVEGVVAPLPKAREDLATGEVAVVPLKLTRHAVAGPEPAGGASAPRGGAERLRARPLELRDPALQARLALRARLALAARAWLADEGFVEVDTPALGRWSPDQAAAQGFAVPHDPGLCFALPAAAREHLLLLPACGFERAFEMGRRLRRAGAGAVDALHQPEHTALDLVVAFADTRDLQRIGEGLVLRLAAEVGAPALEPAARIGWKDALRRYGSDAPDLRLDLALGDAREAVRGADTDAFAGAEEPEGGVYGLVAAGAADALDDAALVALAAGAEGPHGAKVRAFRVAGGRFGGPHAAGIPEHVQDRLRAAIGGRTGDLIVTASAPAWTEAARAAGRARLALSGALGRQEHPARRLAWVEGLPLFEPAPEGGLRQARSPLVRLEGAERGPVSRRDGGHHATTRAFRLALDGVGVASGALLWNDPTEVRAACRMLGLTNTETDQAYGPLLDAMRFGAPPSGLLSFGFDRLVLLLAGASGLDEVMAFPRAADGADALTGAPSAIPHELVRDLLEPF